MKPVRIGIIGSGGMGSFHANNLLAKKIRGAVLTAVADTAPERLKPFPQLRQFATGSALIESGEVDAVLIATPHYSHTPLGIHALRHGLHVLVEKPISVHKLDCQKLIAAHRNKKLIFAAMFQQRTHPALVKIHTMIQTGQLGAIRRFNWIVTNWFRTAAYYDSGSWRATWGGEGGGVLLNQCPHNLDQIFWQFGQPLSVSAHCQFGRYHDIEVEDDVTAYLQYADGASGVFVTTTGEAPGTNRLEITGENGKLVLENDRLVFTENTEPMSKFCRRAKENFAMPKTRLREIKIKPGGSSHNAVIQNFVNAIRCGEPLIAPAEEGIHSVELANAMLLSAFKKQSIRLPLNAGAYAIELKKKIRESVTVKKGSRAAADSDFAKSFGA